MPAWDSAENIQTDGTGNKTPEGDNIPIAAPQKGNFPPQIRDTPHSFHPAQGTPTHSDLTI